MDDVRTRILDVATRLFATRGYGATSVREVVEAAGVTKPTLYYWFANKEALFLEAVTSRIGRMHALLAETLQSGPTPSPDPRGRSLASVELSSSDGPMAGERPGEPAWGDPDVAAPDAEVVDVVARLRVFCARYVRDALADPSGVLLLLTCQLPVEGQPEVDLLSVHDAAIQAIAGTIDVGRRSGALRPELEPHLAAISLLGAFNLLIVAGLHGAPVGADAPDKLLDLYLNGAVVR